MQQTKKIISRISFYNTLSRVLFLLLTPVFFRLFNFAFIWHSVYWGVITFVVIIWAFFILFSPLLGRIGCGWFCFMGTVQDLFFNQAIVKIKKKKISFWIRITAPVGFLASALTFFFLNYNQGVIKQIQFIPYFFTTELNSHYQHIWMYDILGAILFGLLLEKRWACRNLCAMGALCAIGASYSRLLPVLNTSKCNNCKNCEKVCIADIPITDYLTKNKGLVIHPECILCGKCLDVCNKDAIDIKFILNRKKYQPET